MKNLKGKIVFITGATSGIGKASAYKFAEIGCDLILAARRSDRLEKISDELRSKFGIDVLTIQLDVQNYEEVKSGTDGLEGKWKRVYLLLNNAGLARGMASVKDGSVQDWNEMIDTNVKGLLYVSKCVIPLMLHSKEGHIINIGSIAGHEVYPNGNVYSGTKHAVDAITKSMRMELLDSPIRVSTIDPGLVETEFSVVRHRGDEDKAKLTYEGYTPLSPDDIAEAVLFAATRNDNFVVAEMVVFPKAQAGVRDVVRKG
ncbi:MAG TPA: SDR family NAD(P)-dependent oxidoreductase [Ignavibacteria bacterium]|nr:SDR family NAD(P)-dependent oxidoreductase [Ignavibacteria bacterium]